MFVMHLCEPFLSGAPCA